MIPKVKYYGPRIPSTYAVNMTAASSGSNGITVADDDDIDFGTGDFFIHWEGSLPDWTPGFILRLVNKLQDANTRYGIGLSADNNFYLRVFSSGLTTCSADTTTPPAFVDGRLYKITVAVTRETASSAGSASFYINGTLYETDTIASSATPATASNTGPLYIAGYNTTRTASNTISCIVGNFAPAASEVLDLCTNGIPVSWKWGSQTAQTSGTLTVGNMYRINTYVAGDDFTNVGAASNASGVRFTATGTTPTTWTNSSSLVRIGATMALLPDTIPTSSSTTWSDTSGNTGGGTLPAAGATKVTIRR